MDNKGFLGKIQDLVFSIAEVSSPKNKERNLDIIKKRFCLNKEAFYTLGEIGCYYDISRERVRQIESKIIEDLRKIMSGKIIKKKLVATDELIIEYETFKQEIYFQGNIIVENDIYSIIKNKYKTNNYHDSKIIPLLLETLGYFKLPNKIPGYSGDILNCWGLSTNFDKKSVESAFKILASYKFKAEKIKIFNLIIKLKKEYGKKIEQDLLHLILKTCPDFEMADDNHISVRFQSLPNLAEKAYRVLEENKKPMHYNEILREINYRIPNKLANSRALTGQMVSDDRFSAIGRSGQWILKSWDNISTKSITELMEISFHEKNKPQTIDEIYDHVSFKRPGVSKQSIIAYLYDKPQFIRIGDGEYSLSSWGGKPKSKKRKNPDETRLNIKNAIEEVFLKRDRITVAELIKLTTEKSGASELTIRSAIKSCVEIKIVDNKGRSPIVECIDIRLTSLSTKKTRILLREKVQKAVISEMTKLNGKEIQKIDLYGRISKTVECLRPTFYAYLSEMTAVNQYQLDGKYYCKLESPKNTNKSISYLDLSPLENCSDINLKINTIKATDKLNIRDIDIGLFELGRIFENVVKRYLITAKNKSLLTVTRNDLGKLVSMLECLNKNRDKIPIKFKPHHLSLLKEDRNLRAHGEMPTEIERENILLKAPFIVEMYIDYIVKFSVRTEYLESVSKH